SLEEKRIRGVLENASVSLPLDVLDVLVSRSARRIALAHVAETSSEFGKPFAIGRLSDPIHGQVRRLGERWTREQRDGRLVNVDGHVGSDVGEMRPGRRERREFSR